MLGGLSQVFKCLPQVPGLAKVGKRIYDAAASFLRDNEGSVDECLTNLGCEQGAGPKDPFLARPRKVLGDLLGVTDLESQQRPLPGRAHQCARASSSSGQKKRETQT